MNVIMLVFGILVFGLKGLPNLFVVVVQLVIYFQEILERRDLCTSSLYFPLTTRSIYHISVKVKSTQLVNASLSLPTRDPPSIV